MSRRRAVSDLPPGEWSHLLVGRHWPASQAVMTTSTATTSRATIAVAHSEYAGLLQSLLTGPLAAQEGITAEGVRAQFTLDEANTRELSDTNTTKSRSYKYANDRTINLRAELSEIATQGNAEIQRIKSSNESESSKIAEISKVLLESQTRANVKAAACSAELLSAIQEVLSTGAFPLSAREFAQANGFDLEEAFRSPAESNIRDQVMKLFDHPTERHADESSTQNRGIFGAGELQPTSAPNPQITPTQHQLYAGGERTTTSNVQHPIGPLAQPPNSPFTGGEPAIQHATTSTSRTAPIPSQTSFGPATSSTATAPTLTPLSPNLEATTPSIPNTPTALDLPQQLSPTAQPGTPTSSAAEALSNPALGTKHHIPLQAAPIAPISAQAIPSTPVFEAAHATAPPPDVQPITHAPMVQPVATAAPPIQPSTIGATPTVAPSNLPGYGADVRPAVATPSHAPTPAMPTSAPTTSHNSGAHTPSGVVRQQPTEREPVALAEKAYAATSTGAIAAATAQKVAATKRLKDLLAAVVQQEPKLRWAIGDHSNGTTVIATDIAFGWIPPHVEIPAGLTLIQPQSTARSLDALLTGTSGRETFEPGQPKPWADKPQMSTRARETKQPEDLSWSLIQATKWRDGLPRLAHTLAKAATAKTGYLDSEVELLHQHLNRTAQEALDEYPHTSPIPIGNWQLLACIAALIDNEINCANYHLAWFEHSHAKQNT